MPRLVPRSLLRPARHTFSRMALVGGLIVATTSTSVVAQEAERIVAFAPVSSFAVPGGGVAEITSATPDGRTLFYTNASGQVVGVVDLTDPARPRQVATISMPGEPTSVAVSPAGDVALVAVNTSVRKLGAAPIVAPGQLVVVDVATKSVVGNIAIGNGPDSVAVSTPSNGTLLAVVAIENEPLVVDEAGILTDGEDPGLPGDISGPGLVQVVTVDTARPQLSVVRDVTLEPAMLTAAGLFFTEDPQPETVTIRGNRAAVTLQENNGVAIINLAGASVEQVFTTGRVSNRPADLKEDGAISFSDRYPADASGKLAGARTSDGIAWAQSGTVLYTADEGEQNFTGGRGWSMWSDSGELLWDDGGTLEAEAVRRGHYPEGRSANKGTEVEGVTTAVYGNTHLVFVGSERGSYVGVYEIVSGQPPRFLQLLSTGISPEGLLPLPQRNLFITSDEVSGTLTVFQAQTRPYVASASQPILQSASVQEPWSALSSIAGDPTNEAILYAVPDNALPSSIFRIELQSDRGIGQLSRQVAVTQDGKQARFDLEGITRDTSMVAGQSPGWWLASEGNAAFGKSTYKANLLIQVDPQGSVQRQVSLPPEIDSPTGGMVRNNGFEGIAVSDDGRYLLAPIQRDYATDAVRADGARYARIARYDLRDARWDFFLYPLENTMVKGDWIGLSEIVNLGGDRFGVIERDKQVGGTIHLKAVYAFRLDGVQSFAGPLTEGADLAGRVIRKEWVADLAPLFTPFEKVEGLTVTPAGNLWAMLDNDTGEVEPRLRLVSGPGVPPARP